MSSEGFVGTVLAGFADAFAPLEAALGGPDQFAAFVARLGWPAGPGLSAAHLQATFGPLGRDLGTLSQAAQAFRALPASADAAAVAVAVTNLGAAVASAASDVANLAGTATAGLPPPLGEPAFWESMAGELLGMLLSAYLESHFPALFGILRFLGIAASDQVAAAGSQGDYTRSSIDWSKLTSAAGQPGRVFADVYGWGSAFDHARFIDNALTLLAGFGSPVFPDLPESQLVSLYYDPSVPVAASMVELHAPLYWGLVSGPATASVGFSLVMLPIPASGDTTGQPVGFVLAPELTAQAAQSITLGPSAALTLDGSFGSVGAVRIEIRPTGISVAASGLGSTTTFAASAKLTASPSPPWILLGSPGSTRLQVSMAHAALGVAGPVGAPEVTVEAAIDAGQLVLDFSEGDGFLQTLFGGQPQTFSFAVGGQWSSRTGLTLNGQGQMQANIPVHLSLLGVINVDSILVAVGSSAGQSPGAQLVMAATGTVQLGPVTAAITRIGLQASANELPAGTTGNLGDLTIAFRFKPPDGVGLSLTAPGVSGEGFIAFNETDGRYLGAIALTVGDVGISAVGVLDTKLPSGVTGYSLIVVASAQFPPIQLGFGFSLSAIGGLVGVNRTADVPSLQALARAGRLDDLMFPADLIHRAPQVAANLAQQFPVALGHFIVGPSVQIQWGAGGMVYADIGVFIELSDSGGGVTVLRIALLGLVHLTLPDGAAPVADITLDVLGVLDFAAKTLSLDAGLRNSTIATFPLTGQAALRADWGANPEFLFAIGGFNPCFQAPAGFPALQRIALSIGGDNPRLRLSAYLALTSNTLQLGCAADLYASANVAGVTAAVSASLTFDALVQFKPFGLIIDLTISAAILINNNPILVLSLDLHVTGPNPWTVTGSASFHFLFSAITVPICIPGGPPAAPQPATHVDLDGNLLTALADPHSWAIGPPAGRGLVRVRSQSTADTAVHPLGSLTVRQHAVPLGQRIECYGPDLLDAPCRYDITGTGLGAQQASETAVTDFFAPAQFRSMSDQDKLSAPSFEMMTAGITIGSSGLSLAPVPAPGQTPPPVVDSVSMMSWDTLTLDSPDPAPPASAQATPAALSPPVVATPGTTAVPDQLLTAQLGGAAAALAGPAGQPQVIYASPGIGIAVQQPDYALTGLDLTAPATAAAITNWYLPSVTAGLTFAAQAGYQSNWQVVYTSEVS